MHEIWEIRNRTSVIDLSFLLKTMINKFNELRKKNGCFLKRWDTSDVKAVSEHSDSQHLNRYDKEIKKRGNQVMLKRLTIFLGLVLITGCAHKPSVHEMADADYGRVPMHYSQMIIAKIKEGFTDPESIKIKVPRPYPAVRRIGISKGGKYEYGHVVHVWVSTKNELGQYTQRSSMIYWWSNSGWSTRLPSLEGVIPKYPEQAEEYSGVRFTSY